MTKISISGVYGGDDAASAVRRYGTRLKRALKVIERGDYSKDVDSIRVDLAVSGEVPTFPEESGVSNLRIMKSKRRAAARVTMHSNVWTEGDSAIASFLAENLLTTITVLSQKMSKKGLRMDRVALLHVVNQQVLPAFFDSTPAHDG